MAVAVPALRPQSNVAIANAIRNEATSAYQSRIPKATKANVQQTLRDMFNYRPTRNEFVDVLINQVGMHIAHVRMYEDPMAKFRRGKLEYGDTIEEVIVGLAEAHTYDASRDYLEKEVYGQAANDVQAARHKINRQNMYKVTVNESLLQRAFLSENGLHEFVAQLMASATNAAELDSFLLATSLFAEYYKNDGFFKVNVPNILAADSSEAQAKAFLRAVRAMSETLPFYSRHYNAARMPMFAKKEELELFTTPEARAAIDVEALAAAFNIERANIESRITIIPAEQFNIPGAQAILTTRDFFVIANTKKEFTNAFNPAGLYENHFYHVWDVISASPFAPAVLFTTEAGDVINVLETPVTGVQAIEVADSKGTTVTSLTRGNVHVAYSEAITNPVNGLNNAVRYEIVSAANGPLDPRTYISQTGVLSVAISETSTAITINAYAVDAKADETIVATANYPVVGTRAHIWPLGVSQDVDKDGLVEVTPIAPMKSGSTVTIPAVEGVQYYKAGTSVPTGPTTITASTVFTAQAKTGYELAIGATATWTFAP